MKIYKVSVGDLTDLCRGGDINFRFSNRSSAMEGVRGHQRVQKSRGDNYLPEYAVSMLVEDGERALELSGRIDGVFHDQVRQLCVIDEIKTLRVSVTDIPSAVMDGYWLQVLIYAHLLLQETTHDHVLVRLCFFHLDEASEERLERLFTRDEVRQVFTDVLFRYFAYLERRESWFNERARTIAELSFPYGEFRGGQRDLSVAAYRALSRGEHLVIEAPTGLGKTMGTMFPAIRRLEAGDISRVMYVSAKTSTQLQAMSAVEDIVAQGASLRSVVLTAREKICFNPGEPCHPDHCRYARGYYDKLPRVLDGILATDRQFSRQRIEALASEHEVCPFELGLDLASECDVIVADYNYVFDPVVHLRRFFDGRECDSIVLIDEAHNLVDRGRQMFSAGIEKERFLQIARLMSGSAPGVSRAARAVNRAILDCRKASEKDFEAHGHLVESSLPEGVVSALRRFAGAAEEELRAEHTDLAGSREVLLDIYFETLRFLRTAEWFDDTYVFLMNKVGRRHQLQLYCIDPSTRLAEVFERIAGSVAFSATLRPSGFFRQMLGVPESSNWYRLASPFPPENLLVSIASHIDTSFRGREHSIDTLCSLIHDVTAARQGNYLVFFPSYQYLESVRDAYEARYPHCTLLSQARNMTNEDRDSFLNAFDEASEVCGFAVMGGAFSEGIDLKGDRLIGVIVVGVGLPLVGIERDLIRDHFAEQGFEFAYQYPGLTRVLQTAGRLIRDPGDRGVLCLVDRRYAENRYLSLLPDHWDPWVSRDPEEIRDRVTAFWSARS
ncbi:MAG: ATP-dependent DNA helicase [Pseudomonadales bacterium]|nr:ATP-dependent DNA helicase [Pseudomonadales bacterium]